MGKKKKNKQESPLVKNNDGGFQAMPKEERPPSTINIVVIGTGGPGTSCSLLVTTESTRYMFNCGEGTQRLAAMSKGLRLAAFAKLSGLENIFITHKSWENTGGLLGLSMTLEGQLNPESRAYQTREKQLEDSSAAPRSASITIHGPPGVEQTALMARKFSESANLNIVKESGEFSDAALSIQPIPFYETTEDSDERQISEPDAKKFKRDNQETSVAYAYLCQPKPALGKINVEKCLDAGVTIGPMVGQLQRGLSVTLEDGTVVRPEQVTDVVGTEKRPFLVLECPSLEFLPSLCASEAINSRGESLGGESFALVVHMTPEKVFNTDQYQTWMSGFSKPTNHLVLNRSAEEADLIRVRTHQAMLNVVSRDIFPLLPSTSDIVQPSEVNGASKGKTLFACSGMHYVYRGKDLGFQFAPDEFNHAQTQRDCLKIPGLREQLGRLKQPQPLSTVSCDERQTQRKASGSSKSDDKSELEERQMSNTYPRVVFLGTGSSEPNKIRSQSCIVVQLSEDTVIILDCGEDSYGQLYRFYGKEKAGKMLRKIKAIFVSHMHGDHHLGLFSILKERQKAFVSEGSPFTPVLLMAPIQMRRWLRFYHYELESVTHSLRFVKHQKHLRSFGDNFSLPLATVEDVKKELCLSEYMPVEVNHCYNAFGVAFKHESAYKMVYSGDTRPCDNLVEAGADCDLLIHEATHEDALIAHARASKHSTFSEAMDVGARMRAKHVILTHFSQRYSHMVPFFDMELAQNVGIAFDNMQVCPKTVEMLPNLIPPLTTLFSDKLQYLKIKQIKRTREQAENEKHQAEAQERR